MPPAAGDRFRFSPSSDTASSRSQLCGVATGRLRFHSYTNRLAGTRSVVNPPASGSRNHTPGRASPPMSSPCGCVGDASPQPADGAAPRQKEPPGSCTGGLQPANFTENLFLGALEPRFRLMSRGLRSAPAGARKAGACAADPSLPCVCMFPTSRRVPSGPQWPRSTR